MREQRWSAVGTARKDELADIGAVYRGNGTCDFTVWAPLLESVSVKIASPEPRIKPMSRDDRGYWKTTVTGLLPGARYVFRIDNEKDRPDPASRSQPEGVHDPSELIDPGEFPWDDQAWKGISLEEYIIYELHIGAFTPEGTFEAVIPRLDYLKELGITAVEIMPVAQFPGTRNWGYDGVYPFSPQSSYGGPSGLKALVNACHGKGIAVILDVVYNHLGPDGNYLADFAPYFTGKYKTPWGDALNYDGPYSDEVRNYFVQNALFWVTEYHMDGLRLDAVDTIYDFKPGHFLEKLANAVHARARELGRKIFITAECDLNDVRIINPRDIGGYGLDAQWNDDFHHSLHTLITGERKGYYLDFGTIEQMAKAFREGFVYSGAYSRYRKRSHGSSSRERHPRQFIVCTQNHDQIGNRMLGERLFSIASFEQVKLAAACILLSPYIPLLFMGEEYGEKAPFQYFVSHIHDTLIEAVRKGRSMEFSHFEWDGEVPDPQDEKTFLRSKLAPALRTSGRHKILFDYYKMLIRIRKAIPALSNLTKEDMEVTGFDRERAIVVRRGREGSRVTMIYSFNEHPTAIPVIVRAGSWTKLMDSTAAVWGGSGEIAQQAIVSTGEQVLVSMNPFSAVMYQAEGKGA